MNAQVLETLRLDCKEWFDRADFQAFLNAEKPPATWHWRGHEPNDMSDVFMTFERDRLWRRSELWEGSDADLLPDDIYEAIGTLLRTHNLTYGVLWLVNL